MPVQAKHLGASLRLNGPDSERITTLGRIRPNIGSADIGLIRSTIALLTGATVSAAGLTITEELIQE